MNNSDIIRLIEEATAPHFQFNLEDVFGDSGDALPETEELTVLPFKLNAKKTLLSKTRRQELVEIVENLGIAGVGKVEYFKINCVGYFMFVHIERNVILM